VDGTVMLGRRFSQFLQIPQVVRFRGKARLAVVAALNEMLRDAGEIKTRLARHGVLPLRYVASGCFEDEAVAVAGCLWLATSRLDLS